MSLSQTSGLTEETMEKLREEYAKMQLQQALAAQQAQQVYTTQSTTQSTALAQQAHAWGQGTTVSALNPYAQQTPIAIPEEKLDEGAWDVPISQLVDLWTVRYGSKWVNEAELDEFYSVAAKRLKRLNKVEQHYVNASDVYRIVE